MCCLHCYIGAIVRSSRTEPEVRYENGSLGIPLVGSCDQDRTTHSTRHFLALQKAQQQCASRGAAKGVSKVSGHRAWEVLPLLGCVLCMFLGELFVWAGVTLF